MQRHWKRPWIILAVLAAVAASLPAWPAPASQAQTTTYPGEQDPVGNRPSGLTQFADDELVLVSDTIDDHRYGIHEFSPTPEYTLPNGPTSDVPPYPPNGRLSNPAGGSQRQFDVAKGRIVDPARDVALALTKTGYDDSTSTMHWALQELSFQGKHPSTPKTVPPLTWSTKLVAGPWTATSPGALAVGDLDRVADANGAYHAEAVVAYERADPDYGRSRTIELAVVSYAVESGKAVRTVSNVVLGLRQFYEYVCNVSNFNNCPSQHPGPMDVAIGDVDGDGFTEIALVVMHHEDPVGPVLQSHLFS